VSPRHAGQRTPRKRTRRLPPLSSSVTSEWLVHIHDDDVGVNRKSQSSKSYSRFLLLAFVCMDMIGENGFWNKRKLGRREGRDEHTASRTVPSMCTPAIHPPDLPFTARRLLKLTEPSRVCSSFWRARGSHLRTFHDDHPHLSLMSPSSADCRYMCRCLIVRYLEYDQREHKSMRSILREHNAWGFRLIQTLTWSNTPTSSINILCYWD
jgi:hypothetical protein